MGDFVVVFGGVRVECGSANGAAGALPSAFAVTTSGGVVLDSHAPKL